MFHRARVPGQAKGKTHELVGAGSCWYLIWGTSPARHQTLYGDRAGRQIGTPLESEISMSSETNSVCRRVVLETSLKPFGCAQAGDRSGVAERLLRNWDKLITRGKALGILLWVGDGSEILEWTGSLDQSLEWGKYIGFCNLDAMPDLYYPGWYRANAARPFHPHCPSWTYADLKDIIGALRTAARELHGLDISVGATLDPGPEFAFSTFKYKTHPEILFPQTADAVRAPMHFVTAQAELHADGSAFGGFPDGIPEGTGFGTFLGRQYASLADAVGFDYLWLSNGFGYSHFAWIQTGELLQSDGWHTDAASSQREKTNRFWRDFRAECPDTPLEVRGTNFSLGMDLSTDGASHADIAAIGKLDVAPPNLPVLVADLLAQDVVTYLSRMAKSPGSRIIYRTYLNDPWFQQNPWYDIYNKEPLEIYTALSACRVNDEGGVDAPSDFHILTIDTERGELIEDEANEVIPHYLRALTERADQPGPLVWVYPFDEYDAVLKQQPELLPHVFFHDHYITSSVDGGLPLLSVCSSDRLAALAARDALPDAVFLAPAPLGDWSYAQALLDAVRKGTRVVLYGSLHHAPSSLLEALGIAIADRELEGTFRVDSDLSEDFFEDEGDAYRPLRHTAATCGGGLCEVASAEGDVLIEVSQGAAIRAYAVLRALPEWSGGRLAWIRGTVPFALPREAPSFRMNAHPAAETCRTQDWLRYLLAELGTDIRQIRQNAQTEPVRLFVKRHRGAWYFVGSKPNTTVHARVRTGDGAPAFMEYDTPVRDGYGEEHFGKTIYNEVRFFVRMEDGVVRAKNQPVGPGRERCIGLTGCKEATVTIYPDPAALCEGRVTVLPTQNADCDGTPPLAFTEDAARGCLVVENHTGPLFVKW